MKKSNRMWPVFRAIVVCFLFVAFVSSAFSVAPNGKTLISLLSPKKFKGPAHADSTFPFEELEKESENRTEDDTTDDPLSLPGLRRFVLAGPDVCASRHTELPVQPDQNSQVIPIYITICSLRI